MPVNSDSQMKMTLSEELLGCSLRSSPSINMNMSARDPGTSFEVFRNNTTAVEVIVKQLHNKINKASAHSKRRTVNVMETIKDTKTLQEEIDNLRVDLVKTRLQLDATKKCFKNLVFEMKKQLDVVNQRELDLQAKNLNLQLDNDKLHTMLESKSNLIVKFKKELVNMKRIVKFAMRGLSCGAQMPENTFVSDPEYDDFEKGLRKEAFRFRNELDGAFVTFDSTMSKDMNMTSEKF